MIGQQTLTIVVSTHTVKAHVSRARGLRGKILAQKAALDRGIKRPDHMWRPIKTMHEGIFAIRTPSTWVHGGRYASITLAVLHLNIGVPVKTALTVALLELIVIWPRRQRIRMT